MFGINWRYEPCLFTLEPNISGGLKCLGVMEGPRFQDDVILFYIQFLVKDSDPTIAAKETFHLSSAVGNPLKMFQGSSEDFKIIISDPHTHTKSGTRLFLTFGAMTSIQHKGFPLNLILDLTALTISFKRMVHVDPLMIIFQRVLN